MKKELSIGQTKELIKLREWAITIVRFIYEPLGPEIPDYLPDMESIIERAFAACDLRGLRVLSKDMSEWARSLDKNRMQKLNEILKSKFGEDLDSLSRSTKINSIVKKGKVTNIKQYEMLKEYFEEYFNDNTKEVLVEKIAKLLEDFQRRRGVV